MTALIIIGGIAAFITFLLFCSVTAQVEYDGEFKIKIRYLFFRIYPFKEKKKKPQKVKPAPQKPAESGQILSRQEAVAEKTSRSSGNGLPEKSGKFLSDLKNANKNNNLDFEAVMLIIDSVKTPLNRLVRRIRISGFRLDCYVGGSDAGKTALLYGFNSALIGTFTAWLDSLVKLKVDRINVVPDFTSENTRQYLKFKAKLRLWAIIAAALRFFANHIKNNANQKNAAASGQGKDMKHGRTS